MRLFLSTYTNKIDKKGRVSVPASFRSVVAAGSHNSIIAYNSLKNNCIEACSVERIQSLHEMIDKLDPYSAQHEIFSTLVLGKSIELSFDPEGRVVIPEDLMAFAGLKEQACFVGKGNTFEIWNPDQLGGYVASLRQQAKREPRILRLSGGVDAE